MFKYNSSPGVLDAIASEHPYLQLSLASRKLRDQVEAYCYHASQRILSSILPNAEARLKSNQIPEQRLVKKVVRAQMTEGKARMLVEGEVVWRWKWLNLAWRRCAFCGRSTARRAVFEYIVWCCRKCDDRQWPKLVSTFTDTVGKMLITNKHRRNAPKSWPTPQF
jgi:ribosomal protein L37AE/L43A